MSGSSGHFHPECHDVHPNLGANASKFGWFERGTEDLLQHLFGLQLRSVEGRVCFHNEDTVFYLTTFKSEPSGTVLQVAILQMQRLIRGARHTRMASWRCVEVLMDVDGLVSGNWTLCSDGPLSSMICLLIMVFFHSYYIELPELPEGNQQRMGYFCYQESRALKIEDSAQDWMVVVPLLLILWVTREGWAQAKRIYCWQASDHGHCVFSARTMLASSLLFWVSRKDNEPMKVTEQQHLATSTDFKRNMWNSICQQFKV